MHARIINTIIFVIIIIINFIIITVIIIIVLSMERVNFSCAVVKAAGRFNNFFSAHQSNHSARRAHDKNRHIAGKM